MTTEVDPYAPPRAALETQAAPMPGYFIVAERKLWLMSTLTFGLYTIYWWYAHWREQRDHARLQCWPIPRALFSLFFAHAFTRGLARQLPSTQQALGARLSGLATMYVVTYIVSSVATNADNAVVTLGGFALFFVMIGTTVPMQRAANIVAQDPGGRSNASLQGANWLAVVLGGMLWVLVAVGIIAILLGLET